MHDRASQHGVDAGEPPDDGRIDHAAQIDDYLGGFSPPDALATCGPLDRAEVGPLLDTMLLLRQSAAADGVLPSGDAPPMPLRIGRHNILRPAGRGGFATVWEAFDPLLHRRVAVKSLRPEALLSPTGRRRFLREAEIASRLVHPHIVTIFEVGDDGGREYIAAEFCAGGSLADWLARHPGPLAPRTAARLVLALARAVAHAHAAGVIHRDIKPSNVLLVPLETSAGEAAILSIDAGSSAGSAEAGRAGGLTVKLGDFGLGKMHDDADSEDPLTQLTTSGAHIGTPAWMAPEQIDRSFGVVGPATDVHALGLLLDRLLTGRCLRGGAHEAETYRQVILDEADSADRVVVGVPRDLAAVCLKCLAKRPTDRYADAESFADDLARWLAGRPTVARPLSPARRLARHAARRPALTVMAAAAMAATCVAGWTVAERAREAQRSHEKQLALRRQEAVAELRRGFESLQTGSVENSLARFEKARAADPSIVDTFAGRWFRRRIHGESDLLIEPDTIASGTGRPPRDLYAVTLAVGGRMAAAAGADGLLRIVRDLGGRPDVEIVPAHDEVNGVCFSADGSRLASVGQDGLLRWWRTTETGSAALVAAGSAPGVGCPLYAVGFAPDGRSIASGGEDRVVRITRLDAPDAVRELPAILPPPGTAPDIESLVYVDESRMAVACGNILVLLDATTGQVIREFERTTWKNNNLVLGSLTVSPDGGRIMGCGTDTTARIWSVATGRIVTSLPAHPAWVQGCAFSPDGSRVATACRDGVIRIFDATTGARETSLVGHIGRVWSVAFEPNGTLLSSGADGTLRRWDVRIGSDAAGLRPVPVAGDRIELILDCPVSGGPGAMPRRLLVSTGHGPARLVQVPGGDATPLPVAGKSWSVALDEPRGRLAVTHPDADPLTVLSLDPASSTAGSILLPAGASAARGAACWTTEGILVAHAPRRGLFATTTPFARELVAFATVDEHLHTVVASPRAPTLVATGGKRVMIHALPRAGRPTPPPVGPLPLDHDSSCVAWSPDGTLLACGTRRGGVFLCRVADGHAIGTLVPHAREIEAIAWSPDGRALITADHECVRVSDVATLTTLDELRPGWVVLSVCVTADGGLVAIGGEQPNSTDADAARLAVMELTEP